MWCLEILCWYALGGSGHAITKMANAHEKRCYCVFSASWLHPICLNQERNYTRRARQGQSLELVGPWLRSTGHNQDGKYTCLA